MEYGDKILEIVLSKKFYIPLISIVLAYIIIKILNRIVKRIIIKGANDIDTKRRNTIVALLQNIIKYIIFILAILVSLNSWGFDVSGIITGLGVAGVVAGLALQDALKDIIMGCNIILDNYYVVGDVIEVEGFTGEVIEFGLKNTKVKSVDGKVLVIANRQISKVINISQKDSTVIVNIPVSYDEKEEKVIKVLDVIIKRINKLDISTGEAEYLGIDSLGESSVEYMIKARSLATDRYSLKRKVLSIIKEEFDNKGIKIPYTQIEVHNGKKF